VSPCSIPNKEAHMKEILKLNTWAEFEAKYMVSFSGSFMNFEKA